VIDRILPGGISRHGASCLCRYCAPSPAQITARLDLARAGNDMAMIALCRQALAGDRVALGSLYCRLEMEQLTGGAL
jgi:hypothetical protein